MERHITLIALAATLSVLIVGCGDRPLVHVSGKVTHKNEPLPAGEIFFDPDASKKNDGPQGFAKIKDGAYDTAVGGKGIIGGAYVVRIYGYDGQPASEAPLGRALFNGYSESVELPKELTTKDFVIPAN